MAMSQDQIGKTLLKSMIKRLESKGSITIDDIGYMFRDIAKSVSAEDPAVDAFVRSEITKLASFIAEAKSEIFAIVPNSEGDEEEDQFFNAAGEELNAVVQATEEATNTILDASDAIIAVANQLPKGEAQQTIMRETSIIFDACSFQDITGQRINKVIKTLDYVEAKVAKLAHLFGHDNEDIQELARKDAETVLRDERPDADLMDGPQLPGNAISQEDIDNLFND